MDFDVEKVMAEIKVAAPEFVPFLAWCADRTDEDADAFEDGKILPDEFKTVVELVYSYSKSKNDSQETEMTGGDARDI